MKLLIVDDDAAHRTMLNTLIADWGYDLEEADDGSTAIEKVRKEYYDLVLMDNRMLKVSGLEALNQIKTIRPGLPVIIMTAYSSVEIAVEAIRNGAYDYLTKPLDFDKLKLTIQRVIEHSRLREENKQLKERLGSQFDDRDIIGQSAAMNQLMETVAQVSPTEATILINGESGTGKELIASAIHYNSERKNRPFIKVNCAAITETLLESELFGHEKGAFTGADRRKDGRFIQAHGGSLFLDEIGEMPLTMQAKLLRVLQEGELTRVGGDQVIKVDVRIIAATNKNLKEMVDQNGFRQDLYYRLNVVALELAPLRERVEDIPLLTHHFIQRFAEKNHKEIKGVTPEAMRRLTVYDWQGNVRELMNTIERAVILAREDYLDLPDFSIIAPATESVVTASPTLSPDDILPLEEVERKAILQALAMTDDNKSETARRLGITRRTLHQKLKKYGVME